MTEMKNREARRGERDIYTGGAPTDLLVVGQRWFIEKPDPEA